MCNSSNQALDVKSSKYWKVKNVGSKKCWKLKNVGIRKCWNLEGKNVGSQMLEVKCWEVKKCFKLKILKGC